MSSQRLALFECYGSTQDEIDLLHADVYSPSMHKNPVPETRKQLAREFRILRNSQNFKVELLVPGKSWRLRHRLQTWLVFNNSEGS